MIIYFLCAVSKYLLNGNVILYSSQKDLHLCYREFYRQWTLKTVSRQEIFVITSIPLRESPPLGIKKRLQNLILAIIFTLLASYHLHLATFPPISFL